MIQMQTRLSVADNTGAKRAQCIKVPGSTGHKVAALGDVIIASVKKALPGADVKPGDIVRGASLVVWGVRDGRDAADAMHSFLMRRQGADLALAS